MNHSDLLLNTQPEREEILAAVEDPDWQLLRGSLEGTTTTEKLRRLHVYVADHHWGYVGDVHYRAARVQVHNYVSELTQALVHARDPSRLAQLRRQNR